MEKRNEILEQCRRNTETDEFNDVELSARQRDVALNAMYKYSCAVNAALTSENEKLKEALTAADILHEKNLAVLMETLCEKDKLKSELEAVRKELEEAERKILSLKTICKLAKIPDNVIECFSIAEINLDDINWAKDKINIHKSKLTQENNNLHSPSDEQIESYIENFTHTTLEIDTGFRAGAKWVRDNYRGHQTQEGECKCCGQKNGHDIECTKQF